jgi:hypothetical protein
VAPPWHNDRYATVKPEDLTMPAADTTNEAARLQRQVLAGKTADERATMALEMSELVRQLVVDGIRRRHPNLGPDEVTLRLIERLHGRRLAAAVAASGSGRDGG